MGSRSLDPVRRPTGERPIAQFQGINANVAHALRDEILTVRSFEQVTSKRSLLHPPLCLLRSADLISPHQIPTDEEVLQPLLKALALEDELSNDKRMSFGTNGVSTWQRSH